MAFFLFGLFLIFLACVAYKRNKAIRQEQEQEKVFWQNEAKANETRRKDISGLPYLQVPLDKLPFGACPEDGALRQYEDDVRALSERRILNLTGKTNTELKLEYGAANLPELSECDERFTRLVRAMQQWGARLYELGHKDEARQVLSLAISWGSDIKASYLLLARILEEQGDDAGIAQLTEQAKSLDSLMREPILQALGNPISPPEE